MTREKAIESFRRIYPEEEIRIYGVEVVTENDAVVETNFPDGTFAFAVTETSVSPYYRSAEEAKEAILKERGDIEIDR